MTAKKIEHNAVQNSQKKIMPSQRVKNSLIMDLIQIKDMISNLLNKKTSNLDTTELEKISRELNKLILSRNANNIEISTALKEILDSIDKIENKKTSSPLIKDVNDADNIEELEEILDESDNEDPEISEKLLKIKEKLSQRVTVEVTNQENRLDLKSIKP